MGKKQFLRRRAELLKDETRLLEEYTARIRRIHPRCAIILYGSRARGNPLPYSDYDVAIIIEKIDDKLKAIEEFRKLKPRGFSLDLIVLDISELSDPIIRKMFEGSRILYDNINIHKYIK